MKAHCHKFSVDYPRSSDKSINALIHPAIKNKNWISLDKNCPLFIDLEGDPKYFDTNGMAPVFINEASYAEKGIAMSFTEIEFIKIEQNWITDLKGLFPPLS